MQTLNLQDSNIKNPTPSYSSKSLKHLSNHEIELNLKDLVQKERKLLHVILEHIKEIDIRKLYLQKAYSSLYEYLTKEFGYSGSAAMRRIEAARLLKDLPQVALKIQQGSLNLSQIGELSRSIKEKEKISGEKTSVSQKQDLISRIEHKTTLETQKELSIALNIPVQNYESQKLQKDESLRLEITLSKDQYQKLLKCKDQLAHLLEQQQKDSSWASMFEVLADQYLQKSSKTETTQSRTAAVVKNAAPGNKAITPQMRRTILSRDKCCQYQDTLTGRKCLSTYKLQIDHKTSKWAGGANTLENLQLLCAQHNRYKYQREAGIRMV